MTCKGGAVSWDLNGRPTNWVELANDVNNGLFCLFVLLELSSATFVRLVLLLFPNVFNFSTVFLLTNQCLYNQSKPIGLKNNQQKQQVLTSAVDKVTAQIHPSSNHNIIVVYNSGQKEKDTKTFKQTIGGKLIGVIRILRQIFTQLGTQEWNICPIEEIHNDTTVSDETHICRAKNQENGDQMVGEGSNEGILQSKRCTREIPGNLI